MNSFATLILVAWPAIALAAFVSMAPRRAVLATFLAGWMFLPMAGIKLPGLPDYTKVTAICLGTGLGVLLFDSARLFSFRPSALDLPMVVWCSAPLASSVSNGLGVYDGVSGSIVQVFSWGIPYFLGRLYLSDLEAVRELCIAVFVGGLVYVPLCLIEVRLSPQLHRWVYGFSPAPFMAQKRFGGYRPMVFLDSGLATGLWMCMASVAGVWLWRTRAMVALLGVPMAALVAPLVGTAILCKSLGAAALMVMGTGALLVTKWTGTRVVILVLALAPAAYVAVRATGTWSGDQLVSLAEEIDRDRAASLKFRLDNENILAAHALERPLLGWGGWSRNRVYDDRGRDISVTDGLWIIALGKTGLVSVAALIAMFAVPVLGLVRRASPRQWHHAEWAPAAAVAMIVTMYALDNLLNAMLNPVYILGIGGLCGLATSAPAPMARRAHSPGGGGAVRPAVIRG